MKPHMIKISSIKLINFFGLIVVIWIATSLNVAQAQSRIFGGDYNCFLLCKSGDVVAYGYNGTGELGTNNTSNATFPVKVSGLTNVKSIACGSYFSLFLKSNGTIQACGTNSVGQLGNGTTTNSTALVTVSGISTATAVAAGLGSSYALLADSSVVAWGSNFYGQLGDGTNTMRTSPVSVLGLPKIVAISAGAYHALFLGANGAVYSVGYNAMGQLGNGSTTNSNTVVRITALDSNNTKISGGSYHSIVLKTTGNIYTFGYNGYGQLGDATFTNRTSPTYISSVSNVMDICASPFYHTLILLSNGTVLSTGYNGYGQLGDGTTTNRSSFVTVSGLAGVTYIDAGINYSMFQVNDSTFYSCGENAYGQLGDGTTTQRNTVVERFHYCRDYRSVIKFTRKLSITNGNSGLICQNNYINFFGTNAYGAQGFGNSNTNALAKIYSLKTALQVRTHNYNTFFLGSDSFVYGAGYNANGNLGNGTIVNSDTFVRLTALGKARQIAINEYSAAAITQNGELKTWGYNAFGQLGDGTTINKSSPISITLPDQVANVVFGEFHLVILLKNGMVYTAGYNGYGQLGDGTTTSRYTPVFIRSLGQDNIGIAAGNNHTLVLKSDGTVRAFGFNSHGQLGDGTTTNRVTPVTCSSLSGIIAISANGRHSMALHNTNGVYTFGNNTNGQLGDGTTTSRNTAVLMNKSAGAKEIYAGLGNCSFQLGDTSFWSSGRKSDHQFGDNGPNLYSDTVEEIATACPTAAVSGVVQRGNFSAGFSILSFACKDSLARGLGYNASGQLGCGNTATQATVIVATVPAKVKQISTNGYHTLYLTTNGQVYASGLNSYGQLGDGTTVNRSTPVLISGLSNIVAISTGLNHSLALDYAGKVYTWGYNAYGALCDGTFTDKSTPTLVLVDKEFTAIEAGGYSTYLLQRNGWVWSSGYNAYGQLGTNSLTNVATPSLVRRLGKDTRQISSFYFHVLFLQKNGTIKTCGINTGGSLGNGTTISSAIPVAVSGITTAIFVSAGFENSYAVLSNGTVSSWGSNFSGQLGDGTTTSSSVPVSMSGINNAITVTGGYYSVHVNCGDSTIKSCGLNDYYQLGDSTVTNRNTPVTLRYNCSPIALSIPIKYTGVQCLDSKQINLQIELNDKPPGGCKILYSANGIQWYSKSVTIQNSNQINDIIPMQCAEGKTSYFKLLVYEKESEVYNINCKSIVNEKITIVPNPASSSIAIVSSYPLLNAHYFIYSNQGNMVLKGEIKSVQSIDLSTLPSGIYIVRTKGNNMDIVNRFIKL